MSKRSAMAMAAGLVAALLAGAAALSIGLSSPETAQARPDRSEPVVRTITETVTVHKKAKADRTGAVQVVSGPAVQQVSSSAPASYADDDAYEGEDDDGSYEDHDGSSEDHDGGSEDGGGYEDD